MQVAGKQRSRESGRHDSDRMSQEITQVDAFADRPFTGNPAAVCLLPDARSAEWMQLVAREMNLSETAFLVRRNGGFDLRWFTPAVEVDLCGHATLASAHVLWEQGHLAGDRAAVFYTRSGELTARKQGDWIELNFPATLAQPLENGTAAQAAALIEAAIGVKPRFVGQSRFDFLVEVDGEEIVRSLAPDITAIGRVGARGVIITSRASSKEYDYVSRFFAPCAGVPEDPVTGSAHCALGPYWAKRLGRDDLLAYQASARGGFVRTRCEGDRVFLSGRAITVLRGELV